MPKIFKTKHKLGWLAVVLGEGRLDCIHVRRDPGRRPQVLLAESIERRGDDTKSLTALRKSMGLGAYRCTTMLSQGEYQLIQVDAPPGPVAEAREMMRWKLKDQVDFPVDDATIDLLPIPGAGRSSQMFAAIASGGAVSSRVQTFKSAKIPLSVIDLPELSQRNVAALFEERGRSLATLIFEDREGTLTFTKDGELLASRRIEQSSRQFLDSDAERKQSLFERLALTVQRAVDNFERANSASANAAPLSRLLVAPIPGVEGLIDYLRANLTVAVAPLEIGTAVDFGAVPAMLDPYRQYQSLRALGAALRDEAGVT